MRISAAFGIAATVGCASAQRNILGFNSGASDDQSNPKTQKDFEREFRTAQNLEGAPSEINTIRLYSNVQWQTKDTPIAALSAAVATNTSLLLGIWASGTDNIDNELNALEAALEEHGSDLADLVVGISVGSEDMYRISASGIRNNAGVGNDADTIVRFIRDARARLNGTALADKPYTHVDSWSAWVNSSNAAVIDEVDFVSVNIFPFYEDPIDNRIENAGGILNSALTATEQAAGGKDVWITETGWAYSGPALGAAESTVDNAGTYWQDVGCLLFGRRNVFWYTLRDANPENEVKFAVTDKLSTTPRFNLTCPAGSENMTLPAPIDVVASLNATATGAGIMTSVSTFNSFAIALSLLGALAAWVL
ncbi:glucan endo-1,3-beta-D-glucosidase [Alternaria panax]|uniref:Glucan endo-1,3-beta-D-glucosidase n=1 Tax=Alternaria panax TaxID=48097 RepID=A0AAD4IHF9_9PLEO|nr:glucan endo-1,3-beta-D-glucosidase [Alternaria panax]